MASAVICCGCNKALGTSSKVIGCDICPAWAHLKCVHLDGVKMEDIKLLDWACGPCFQGMKSVRKDITEMKEIMKSLQEQVQMVLSGNLKEVTKVLEEVSASVSAESTVVKSPWTEVVKKKKITEKKNLLVVQSTDENVKVKDNKKEMVKALEGTQIVDSRFTQKGVVLNFEDEAKRDEAASKLHAFPKVKTRAVRKLKPKIMICNVNKEEAAVGEIIDVLIDKNEYLQHVDDVKSKLELLFCRPASGGTQHYIIRCDPEIRRLIHVNHDRLKLDWGVYFVRDRYMATICYHCQRIGHVAQKCSAMQKQEPPVCGKCAGEHNTRNCVADRKQCINCIRFKKADVGHAANDGRLCEVLLEEQEKIRCITENGY